MDEAVFLWEILVPKNNPRGESIALSCHHMWDRKVRTITGGLTILKSVRGQWISQDKTLFIEPMIPVRIACTREEIEQIATITAKHYQQQAVMFYLVSKQVTILHYNENGDRV